MRSICTWVLTFCLGSFGLLKAQTLLQQETVPHLKNVEAQAQTVENTGYYLVHMHRTPNAAERKEAKSQGIEFLDYYPKHSYSVWLQQPVTHQQLHAFGVEGIQPFKQSWKLDPAVVSGELPQWTYAENGKLWLVVKPFPNLSKQEAEAKAKEAGFQVVPSPNFGMGFLVELEAPLSPQNVPDWVQYISPMTDPGEPENREGKANHRTHFLRLNAGSNIHLDGTGVKVMLNDDGPIRPHIDFHNRIDDQGFVDYGSHGDHCGGTINAAGNLEPRGEGNAPGAWLRVYNYTTNPASPDGFFSFPGSYVNDSIVITSNSYSNGCNSGYNFLAQYLDGTVRTHKGLMHVFSAGNSGSSNCSYGAGSGWGNITGGHKVGKNVIAVGNVQKSDALASSSSRGPAHDGRIKPDVCAVGTSVYSTYDNSSQYASLTGTSMACPGVAGAMAVMHEGYRALNNDQIPHSGLLKGILMNTAEDLGNSGPDYRYGYGRINIRRAYESIQNNWYLYDSLDQGNTKTYTITVPQGLREVRIMLYWHDIPAQQNASRALVNDLDMVVTEPGGQSYQPWVLNPTPNSSALNSTAVRARDSLNNMEQVTLLLPTAGTYTVTVNGFNVPQGPQDYHLTWDLVPEELVVVFPAGGEGFAPGAQERIYWDYYGMPGNFTLDYSTDNGQTWNNIAGVSSSTRNYLWTVPNSPTGQARVRVTRGNLSDMGQAPFSIMPVPTGLQTDTICPYSVKLEWNTVPGATGYDVFMLGNLYMDSVGTTTQTEFTVAPVNTANDNWFSVRARGANGAVSERARAIRQNAGWGPCDPVYDLAMEPISFPFAPRTPSCLQGEPVTIHLKNHSYTPFTNVPVFYQVDNGPVVNATITGTIAPQSDTMFVFPQPLSTTGNGPFTLTVGHNDSNDNLPNNNSQTISFQWDNSTAATLPWTEDFETMNVCGAPSGCEASNCNLGNSLINIENGSSDQSNWIVWSGLTPTSGTGPSMDFIPGNSNGHYAYLESSGCGLNEAHMLLPCMDLSNTTKVYGSYGYHLDANTTSSIHVDVFSQGQWHNDISFVDQGNGFWERDTFDLSPFTGQKVVVRIRAVNGQTGLGDPAIDGIVVTDISAGFTMPDTLCIGDAVQVQNQAQGLIQNYQWSFGSSATPPSSSMEQPTVTFQAVGNVQVQQSIVGHDTMLVDNRQVTVLDVPQVAFSAGFNGGLSYTFDGSASGPGTYTWDLGDGTQASGPVANHTYSQTGAYDVVLIVTNLCGTDSLRKTVNFTGLETVSPQGMRWYPNPSKDGIFYLEWLPMAAEIDFQLLDITGRLLYQTKIQGQAGQFAVEQPLPSGVYLVQMQWNDQRIGGRLVVE